MKNTLSYCTIECEYVNLFGLVWSCILCIVVYSCILYNDYEVEYCTVHHEVVYIEKDSTFIE